MSTQTLIFDAQPVMAPHRKLNVDEYRRMGEAGILQEDDRVELITGELIEMAPIGSLHAGIGGLLMEWLGYPTAGLAIAWAQNPIHLNNYSEPQPDFALLRFRQDRYKTALPTAQDVLLVVEIADKSLCYDRDTKTPLYARHGIPEYWIVNIPKQCIEIHRQPDPVHGVYLELCTANQGLLAPAGFPDTAFDVADLFR
jgi:Uma2 family endonuclease